MEEKLYFAAVEFVDDPNVVGIKYWYGCPFYEVKVGDEVIAPLGRHNNVQKGVVREVRWAEPYNAPYPLYLIKYIKEIVKKDEE